MQITGIPMSNHALPRSGSTLALGLVLCACPIAPAAQDPPRSGTNYIAAPVFPAEDDERILEAFAGLRVADVADGMEALGLQNVGLMEPEIHPLWRDPVEFAHRFVGIAVTARYVPTQRPPAGERAIDDYDRWAGDWYNRLSPEPFQALLRPGSALVIEDAPNADVGSIGSNNILSWKLRGCVGVVTSATARDTDEIITQQIPLYLKHPGRGIRPGRNELESVNRPIVCGGALVIPGDVIVADGDGVLVVPRALRKTGNRAGQIGGMTLSRMSSKRSVRFPSCARLRADRWYDRVSI
jgi:regulator of RNase E activity RraA